MSIVMTIVLGIVGSFVGGFLGYLIFHKDASHGVLQPAGHHRVDHRRDHRAADLDPRRQPPRHLRTAGSSHRRAATGPVRCCAARRVWLDRSVTGRLPRGGWVGARIRPLSRGRGLRRLP